MSRRRVVILWAETNALVLKLSEEHFICQTLELESNIFNIDTAIADLETKKNVWAALYFLVGIKTKNIYRILNGLHYLQFLDSLQELIEGLEKAKKYSPTKRYNRELSKLIMDSLGTFRTLKLISGGCLLDYQGALDCRFPKIDDALLEKAKDSLTITEMYCASNPNITSINIFGDTLTKLDACFSSGINDEGLREAYNLEWLDVSGNKKITTIKPFGGSLKILRALGSGIESRKLKYAIRLEELEIGSSARSEGIDFSPFSSTLKILSLSGSGVNDEQMACLLNLEVLKLSDNGAITTVKPFARTLRKLFLFFTAMSDKSLEGVKNLEILMASGHPNITLGQDKSEASSSIVAPFAKILRILSADWKCGISNQGLKGATNLEFLSSSHNPKITIKIPCK